MTWFACGVHMTLICIVTEALGLQPGASITQQRSNNRLTMQRRSFSLDHKVSYCMEPQIVFVLQVVSSQLLLTHAACVWTDHSAQPQRRMLAQCEPACNPPRVSTGLNSNFKPLSSCESLQHVILPASVLQCLHGSHGQLLFCINDARHSGLAWSAMKIGVNGTCCIQDAHAPYWLLSPAKIL